MSLDQDLRLVADVERGTVQLHLTHPMLAGTIVVEMPLSTATEFASVFAEKIAIIRGSMSKAGAA